MRDLFGRKEPVNIKNIVCHSGGASGSDMFWEEHITQNGGKCVAYSYKTYYHTSPNKFEISESDFQEGIDMVKKSCLKMKRRFSEKYINLTARDWSQVKYSSQVIAIGKIENIKEGIIKGGTGYAVMMGILTDKIVNVFDQDLNQWFEYKNDIGLVEVLNSDVYIICNDFAGIGTRDLKDNGKKAILDVISHSIIKSN